MTASRQDLRGWRLGRGLAVLGAGVAVVLAGSILVLVESSASPPPSQVMRGAQRFAAAAGSLSYGAAMSVASPLGGGGEQLLRPRTVTGADRFGRAADFTVTMSTATGAGAGVEYRMVAPDTGVWVRASPDVARLAGARWVHAPDYRTFEALVLVGQTGTPAGANPTDLIRATLLDDLSSGAVVRRLVAAARDPHRHGSRVRTIDVRFDPDIAFGALGPAVDAASGQVTVDAHDRPMALWVHVRAGPGTIDVRYSLSWGTPVSVSAPAPADVVADL